MKKESPSSIATQLSKVELRPVLKQKRSGLSLQRRYEARQALVEKLLPLLKNYKSILSFHSLPAEIDLSLVNQPLAEEGKLHLPKIHHEQLLLYRVQDLTTLTPSKWGFYEPDPTCSESIHPDNLDCILVPGLGFDADRIELDMEKGITTGSLLLYALRGGLGLDSKNSIGKRVFRTMSMTSIWMKFDFTD